MEGDSVVPEGARGLPRKGSIDVLKHFPAPGMCWTGRVLIKNPSMVFNAFINSPCRCCGQIEQQDDGPGFHDPDWISIDRPSASGASTDRFLHMSTHPSL